MAKKANIAEEDFSNEIPNEETTVDATPAKPEARVNTEVKKVRIRAVEDINSLIACVPYTIAKDKEVLVPSDVAAILCFARKAYRL